MKLKIFIISLLIASISSAQISDFTDTEISISDMIDGTLLAPNTDEKTDLVIIIAGSGPTNRNGNQNILKNNNLKKLAEALAVNNISSFRYDKRIVKQIKTGKIDVESIRFEDFVNDAKDVVAYFKDKDEFKNIYIAGHSQGSLVGMLAMDDVDGFISLAGAGQNIGDVIVEQINNTARQFVEETKKVVTELKAGKTTKDFPPALSSMFNMQIQPFMISWMKYNPVEIIETIKQPILIINGTKDLQVSVDEAKLLSNGNKDAELVIIENMNHVLFTIEGDRLENSKSYNESFRELNKELIDTIVTFIKNKE
ncbi:alpha/beta hydrolase [Winogradskyella litorisediminis]|uniref:Alpha/beta hydrolase n=1 Tax=Winogradskyella litorisediminis TaxID=1156618 RepID=A0ABW3NAS6_9FLAO